MKYLIGSIATVMLCLATFGSSSAQAQRGQTRNGGSSADVGSSAWFEAEETKTAHRFGLTPRLRTEYVSVLGQFVFPKGNRFPGKQLPDLQISCVDQYADGADRGPMYINQQAEPPYFFTRLKRGQIYKFGWLYYLGSKDQFGTWRVPEDAPGRIRLVISYEKGNSSFEMQSSDEPAKFTSELSAQSQMPPPSNAAASEEEIDANTWDLKGLPNPPTTDFERDVLDAVRAAQQQNATRSTKAMGHRFLASYYAKKRDWERAYREMVRRDYWRD